jgi:hypothetical protein
VRDIGSANGRRSTLNIQPVIPIELNQDWNLISRTILPVVEQQDVAGQSGGDNVLHPVARALRRPAGTGKETDDQPLDT